MVLLESVTDEDEAELRDLVARHAEYTGSTVARTLLERWPEARGEFVKVMPEDYKRVLEAQRDGETAKVTAAAG
jgi:glutamate synthase domain-containing protein 3